jgi:flagellar basal body-associated protein FliL
MNDRELAQAYQTLQQPTQKKSNKLLWIILGIIFSIVFIIVALIVIWLRSTMTGESPGGSGTYPYIPTPKNTAKSSSVYDLIGNIILDLYDTGIDYSVLSRLDIQNR